MPFTLLKNIATVLLICILYAGEYVSSQGSKYDSLFINEYFGLDATLFKSNLPQKYNIYPNPCSGIINIRALNGWRYPAKVEIFNSLRQRVFELSFDKQSYNSDKEIDISNLPDGMYFFCISSDKTEYIEKLIIAK